MTLPGMAEKGKAVLEAIPRDVFVVLILLFSCVASFGLGVLAARDMGQGSAFSVSQIPLTASPLGSIAATPLPTSIPAGGQVVASKNGTKYFLPWCGGASQIKEENKIWFATKEKAEEAGYAPASNCKGL